MVVDNSAGFIKKYKLSSKGKSAKRIKISRDVIVEEVAKYFRPIQNNNGYNYIFNEDPLFRTKVERLWMFIHQKRCVLSTRIMSLGFARGVILEI